MSEIANLELADVDAKIETEPHYAVALLGVLVDLREPADVARTLDEVREAKRILDEARGFLELVLRAESIRQGSKTLHLEGFDAEVSGGSKPVVADPELLAEELEEAGLPPERLAQAVRIVIERKVDHRELNRLAAASPVYAEIIARHRRQEPAPWRVFVKRTRGGPDA